MVAHMHCIIGHLIKAKREYNIRPVSEGYSIHSNTTDLHILNKRIYPITEPISCLEIGEDPLLVELFVKFPHIQFYRKVIRYGNTIAGEEFLCVDTINNITIESRKDVLF